MTPTLRAAGGHFVGSLLLLALATSAGAQQPAPFGLDQRPSNTTCLAWDRPNAGASVSLQRVYDQVFSTFPVGGLDVLTMPPNDSSQWYFATRDGLIGRFQNTSGVNDWSEVLDLTGRVTVPPDGGLIQLIFHPNYPADPRVFLNYSVAPTGGELADVIISSMETTDGGATFDPSTEVILVRQSRGTYHQGGFMEFDSDGMLMFSLGDGTVQGDPQGNAQNLDDFRGNVLRIDVDSGFPYSIPDDNPFALSGGSPLSEIWAYGFRNPFRGDIDPETGQLWIGDVGYSSWEEVSLVTRGGNHGWNIKEGSHCLSEAYGSCSDPTLIDPVVEYPHSNGNCAVIGGYVYRGTTIPELQGKFVFADYCTSKVSAVDFDDNGDPFEATLLPGGSGLGNIRTFGQDNDGELYVVTGNQIHKVLPAGAPSASGPPAQLSQTGCFNPLDPTEADPALIPYIINTALWSDGATKRRWMALPDGATIDIAPDGDFLFPPGTILWKEFSFDGAPVETRAFVRHNDGVWAGYSWEWTGSDAFLLPAGKVKELSNGQSYYFPSRAECLRCHTDVANFSLGPELAQLNRDGVYPQTNRISNQLATLDHINVLTNGLPLPVEEIPTLAEITDTHRPVVTRARSYLHINCSGCHRGEGVTQAQMDFRFSASRADMRVCNVDPAFGDLGISGAKLLLPGDPLGSIFRMRHASTDPLVRMPPLATSVVNDAAIAIFDEWISSPDVCALEVDTDGDGAPDDADNCVNASNPNQADSDRDGIGDRCDPDPYDASLTGLGTVVARVPTPLGDGNRDLEVIRDGDFPPVSNVDSTRQYDTWDGANTASEDWIGYVYSSSQVFGKVVFQEGMHFFDGGWFDSLTVQVRQGGVWVPVNGLSITPAYAGNNGINYESYEITFDPTAGDGVRIYGAPGGSADFISVGELEVYGPASQVTCGDGNLDAEEECDDGNIASGDGCSALCVVEFCGDGLVNDVTETCEPPSTATCEADCTVRTPLCGDGFVTFPETCEPPGTATCNDNCAARVQVCGDGFLTPPETCEDGNNISGDGCSSTCQVEGQTGGVDVTGDGTPISFAVPSGSGNHDPEVMRDGDKPPVGSSDPSRQYDTWNGGAPRALDWVGYTYGSEQLFNRVVFQEGMHFFDGGWFDSLTVQVRQGGVWVPVNGLSITPAYAGNNGINYESYEITFDPTAGDGVRIYGAPGGSADFISVGELEVYGLASQVTCGDGNLDAEEECDDGNIASGDGCSALCVVEFCGDGLVNDVTETCEPPSTATCEADCTVRTPLCGDGFVTFPETCEPPGTATCNDNCAARVQVCGDGFLTPPETCEDGNNISGDGCSSTCQVEGQTGGVDVTGDGTPISFAVPSGSGNHDPEVMRDGDKPPVGSSDPSRQYDTWNGGAPRALDWVGYTYGSEQLFNRVVFQEGMHFFDGGWFDSLTVQVRQGGVWVPVNGLSITPAYAGNNGINYESYEITFDPTAGDGVRIYGAPGGSADFISVGELEVYGLASQVTCGDGNLDAEEECDDGNIASGDGCSALCVVEFCGDGLVNDVTETCEPPSTATCEADCTVRTPLCGDGFVTFPETCEDGNTLGGDGCAANCQIEPNGEDLTDLGTVVARVPTPLGDGNRDLEVIRDGDFPPVSNVDSTRQYDTWDGANTASEDWIGYVYSSSQVFGKVVFQEGMHFFDGGWFDSLTVQVRQGGVWVPVNGLSITPAYAGNNGINYESYEITFDPTAGDGVRIYGAPGGSADFISVGELEVYASSQ